MSKPDYSKHPENPFGRATNLKEALLMERTIESQYTNGILPEPQYRAEMKVIRARIKELGG